MRNIDFYETGILVRKVHQLDGFCWQSSFLDQTSASINFNVLGRGLVKFLIRVTEISYILDVYINGEKVIGFEQPVPRYEDFIANMIIEIRDLKLGL